MAPNLKDPKEADRRRTAIRHAQKAFAVMPVYDRQSADEIIGYDEHGLPTQLSPPNRPGPPIRPADR